MVEIDPNSKKYIITFKPKADRPNKRDDKLEIFRHIIGLRDTNDILDLSRYTGNHMTDEIRKTKQTVTDINSYETPFIMARLTTEQASRVRKDPNVQYVEESGIDHITAEEIGYQIPAVQADSAWASPLSTFGSGVNVGIIDTGVDSTHADLRGHVKVEQNFVEDSLGFRGGHDHGTHVAGITGAIRGNAVGIAGVAPSCNIWNLRAGDVDGAFFVTDIIEAITYGYQNGVHILNMSFGGQTDNVSRAALIQDLYDNKNIMFVASAGNLEGNTINYPANSYGVIGVSNIEEDLRTLSPTSNYGTHVDVTAPGVDIWSCGFNNTIVQKTGTSMSAPVVSGVCALAVSAYRENACGPPYTPGIPRNKLIEKIMFETADKLGQTNKNILFGYGMPRADMIVSSLKGILVNAL